MGDIFNGFKDKRNAIFDLSKHNSIIFQTELSPKLTI